VRFGPTSCFPPTWRGFNLVEAFYMAIPHLSWQTVVIGDPLCAPFARRPLAKNEIDAGMDAQLTLPAFFGKRRQAVIAASMPGAPERAAQLVVRSEVAIGAVTGLRDGACWRKRPNWRPTWQVCTSCWHTFTRRRVELEAAAGRYAKALALQPNNLEALNNLAYDMAVRQKKPAEALPMARKALMLSKGDPVVMDTVGWIEYLQGNNAEAARLLVQAAKGAPGNAEVRLHAAFALASQGLGGRRRGPNWPRRSNCSHPWGSEPTSRN
jgi:tetratricopeptide (TPR) repeat protein